MPTHHHVPAENLRHSSAMLLLALGLIAALCVFFVREAIALQVILRDLRDLRDNDVARMEIHDVLVDLVDAETGQRGYLLTGDPAYLEPYLRGRNDVRDSIRRASESVLMDEQLKADGPQIMLLAERKLEELERTIVLRRKGDSAAALEVVKQGYGKATMDQARALIQQDLTRLRARRDLILDDLRERLSRAAVFLVLILVTAATLALYAWRAQANSARLNQDLARQLAQEASHDVLTGLPNRRFFDRWAQQLLMRGKREPIVFALLLIDLDGFKKVNDGFGHGVGDEVLASAAGRLKSVLRAGEFLARLGGDEFGVLVEGDLPRADLAGLGERMIASLAPALHPLLADGAVGASIGVSMYPRHGSDIGSLTEAADAALYRSKEAGRGRVSFSVRRAIAALDPNDGPAAQAGGRAASRRRGA